jgi:hypothetical protein
VAAHPVRDGRERATVREDVGKYRVLLIRSLARDGLDGEARL